MHSGEPHSHRFAYIHVYIAQPLTLIIHILIGKALHVYVPNAELYSYIAGNRLNFM